jgi:DNA-binding CsgD family transcriptional regulator
VQILNIPFDPFFGAFKLSFIRFLMCENQTLVIFCNWNYNLICLAWTLSFTALFNGELIMENTYLTESEYIKILSFIEQMKKNNNNFQQNVINLIHSIFGYQHLTFNLINHKFELYSPRLCNITENARDQYYAYYYKTDIFNPKSTMNLWFSKRVISVTDIMPASQYENSEYYMDFLKPDMLYYELAMPLVANNRLIGGIGVFKQKDENNFTSRDVAILNKLNEFIASDLWTFLEFTNIQKDYQTYNNCFDQTPIGIILLDKNFSVINCNKTAEALISGLHIFVQQFICEIISRYSNEFSNLSEMKFFYKSLEVNLVLNRIYSVCSGVDPVYTIFISEDKERKWIDDGKFQERNNLTARESEILELVKNGLSNEEIAAHLYISIHTVKAHMENIFKKLEVKNRTSALCKIDKTHYND